LFDLISKAQRKKNVNKLEIHEIENLCSVNDSMKGMKIQEKSGRMFANHLSNKRLVFRK
jgi:hypothetical protein